MQIPPVLTRNLLELNVTFVLIIKKLLPTDNYYSNDGACITTLNGQSSILYYDHFNIIVDINCAKRPNKVGYDRFVILFNDNNGSLYTEENANMCTSYIDYEDEDEDIEALKLILGGYSCFCKIVQDGWKMNY